MNIRKLIQAQTIKLDSHRQGTGQPNSYGDTSGEIHIHKKIIRDPNTYEIRIPIQMNRNVSVVCENICDHVPAKLKKEISIALDNEATRLHFYKEVFESLKDFSWSWNVGEARDIIERITSAFGLVTNNKDVKEVGKFFASQMTDGQRVFQVVLNYDRKCVYIGECMDGWEPENLNF